MHVGSREVWFGTCAGIVRTCLSHRFVLVLTLFPRAFPRGSTTLLKRDAHVGEYIRENLLHERT